MTMNAAPITVERTTGRVTVKDARSGDAPRLELTGETPGLMERLPGCEPACLEIINQEKEAVFG